MSSTHHCSDDADFSLTIEEQLVACPLCARPNPADASFCFHDGEPLKPGLARPTVAGAETLSEGQPLALPANGIRGKGTVRLPDELLVPPPLPDQEELIPPPLPSVVPTWDVPVAVAPDAPVEWSPAPGDFDLELGQAPEANWAPQPVEYELEVLSPGPAPMQVPMQAVPIPAIPLDATPLQAVPIYEPPPDPLLPLQGACAVEEKDWDLIRCLADDLIDGGVVLTPELRILEREARRRYDCRRRLGDAVAQRNLADIIRHYDPALLDDWAACSELVALARQAQEAWRRIREIQDLAGRSATASAALEAWARHAPALAAWPEATKPLRDALAHIEARNRAWDALQDVLKLAVPSESAIAAAGDALWKLGGHPDAGSVQERVRVAGLRAACLDRLPAPHLAPSEALDARLLSAWDETLLNDCPEAQVHRPRFEAAKERLGIVSDLDQIVAQVDAGTLPERAIGEKARALPAGYTHRHLQRSESSSRRVAAQEKWRQTLAKDAPSDREIVRRWNEARQAGVRLDPASMRRGQLAVKRTQRLAEIARIDPTSPRDHQDKRWLTLWDAALFEGCADAEPLRARYVEAKARLRAWRGLSKAMNDQDLEQLLVWAREPLLRGYPPVLRAQEELKVLLHRAKAARSLRQALAGEDVEAFVAQLDLDFLRTHVGLFADRREAIEDILRRWLRAAPRILAAEPASTRESQTGRLIVRWTWRHFKHVSHCKIAMHPERFFDDMVDCAGQTMLWDAESHRRAGGGVPVWTAPGKTRVHLTVWPVIDLGWTELTGPPLHLGPFKTPSAPDR